MRTDRYISKLESNLQTKNHSWKLKKPKVVFWIANNSHFERIFSCLLTKLIVLGFTQNRSDTSTGIFPNNYQEENSVS